MPETKPNLGPLGELLPEGAELPSEITGLIPNLPSPQMPGAGTDTFDSPSLSGLNDVVAQAGIPRIF
nr:hypothetical protein [Corynebacterium lactis]